MTIPLCRVDDIPVPGARGFVFGEGTARREIFLVRTSEGVFAYENACPHQGTPLETFPDRFLTADGRLIVCSTHGARFRPSDGYCVSGPCKGKALRRIAIEVESEMVRLR